MRSDVADPIFLLFVTLSFDEVRVLKFDSLVKILANQKERRPIFISYLKSSKKRTPPVKHMEQYINSKNLEFRSESHSESQYRIRNSAMMT